MAKVTAQAKPIDRGGHRLREKTRRLADHDDLLRKGSTMGAGGEVQRDTRLGQHREPVIQVVGGSISDVAASQATGDPLGRVVFHAGSLSQESGVSSLCPLVE